MSPPRRVGSSSSPVKRACGNSFRPRKRSKTPTSPRCPPSATSISTTMCSDRPTHRRNTPSTTYSPTSKRSTSPPINSKLSTSAAPTRRSANSMSRKTSWRTSLPPVSPSSRRPISPKTSSPTSAIRRTTAASATISRSRRPPGRCTRVAMPPLSTRPWAATMPISTPRAPKPPMLSSTSPSISSTSSRCPPSLRT